MLEEVGEALLGVGLVQRSGVDDEDLDSEKELSAEAGVDEGERTASIAAGDAGTGPETGSPSSTASKRSGSPGASIASAC